MSKTIFFLASILLATPVVGEEARSGDVRVTFDANTPPVAYGADKLEAALTTAAYALDDNGASIVRIEVVRDAELSSAESFRIVRADKGTLVIRGAGPSGAMWFADTFIAGMKAAKRPIKFIHRAPLSADKGQGGSTGVAVEKMTRSSIESLDLPQPIWIEMKFNWSHALSSPHLVQVHGGQLSDTYWNPPPKNYKMTWMVRNEDVFCLRWGEPDFIRRHIALNGQDYVGGYFVGSECYIPASDYFTKPDVPKDWQYAFQRQWFFYKAWGRLLYDPATKDEVFKADFHRRYGADGEKIHAALVLGSRMPLRLNSFYKATWDFTSYAEGFLATAGSGGAFDGSPFISVDELIDHATLDPDYVSIKDFVAATTAKRPIAGGKITPLMLADELERDGREALRLVDGLDITGKPAFAEVTDCRAWAYLSLYFADNDPPGEARGRSLPLVALSPRCETRCGIS